MADRAGTDPRPVPYFVGRTADEVWRSAADAVLKRDLPTRPGRGGETSEILHAVLRILDPRQRWVHSRRPGLNPAFAIVEAFWILGGRDDADLVNFWNPALPRFAGRTPQYPGAYGHRLRKAFGLDQIEAAIDALAGNPESRQTVLQTWHPNRDFPRDGGRPASPDIPCNICSMLKVRDGRLEWMQVMRSNDLFRGTPHNLVQFTVLQEYVAGCLGIEPGEFVLVADSLHAYHTDREAFGFEAVDAPVATTRIALPRLDAGKALERVLHSLDRLRDPDLAPEVLEEIMMGIDLPTGHADMLRIAAADAARRREWPKLAATAVALCGDPALVSLWRRWAENRPTTRNGWSPAKP